MHLLCRQEIWQAVSYTFIRVMAHLNFGARTLQVLVKQIAAAYIADQRAAGAWVKTAVAVLIRCDLGDRLAAKIMFQICLTIRIERD